MRQRVRVSVRVRALDGTLCSMHTAKRATHTGTDARITWRMRSHVRSREAHEVVVGCVRFRVMHAGVAMRSPTRGGGLGRAGLSLQGAGRAGCRVRAAACRKVWRRACLVHRELHDGERGVVARDLEAVHQRDGHEALPVVLDHVHVLVRVLRAEEHERRGSVVRLRVRVRVRVRLRVRVRVRARPRVRVRVRCELRPGSGLALRARHLRNMSGDSAQLPKIMWQAVMKRGKRRPCRPRAHLFIRFSMLFSPRYLRTHHRERAMRSGSGTSHVCTACTSW